MSANERHWLLSTLGWKKPLVRIAALRVRLSCTTRDHAWFTMHEWRVVSPPPPLSQFCLLSINLFFFFSLFFFPSRLLPTLIFFNQIRGRKYNVTRLSFLKLSIRRDTMNKTDISTCPDIFREFWKYLTEKIFVRDEFTGTKKSGKITKRSSRCFSPSLSTIRSKFSTNYSTDRDNTYERRAYLAYRDHDASFVSITARKRSRTKDESRQLQGLKQEGPAKVSLLARLLFFRRLHMPPRVNERISF